MVLTSSGGTEASGTHPTGMLSCFVLLFKIFILPTSGVLPLLNRLCTTKASS